MSWWFSVDFEVGLILARVEEKPLNRVFILGYFCMIWFQSPSVSLTTPSAFVFVVPCGFPDQNGTLNWGVQRLLLLNYLTGYLFFPLWFCFHFQFQANLISWGKAPLSHSHFLLFTCAKSPQIFKVPVSTHSFMIDVCSPSVYNLTVWPEVLSHRGERKRGYVPARIT